jgi:RNA polymerase sigma factor (sigma-70 family)
VYVITEEDIQITKALARKEARRWSRDIVEYDDLLGDAFEGLVKASYGFDSNKVTSDNGRPFWSYATVAVKRAMLEGIRKRIGKEGQKLDMAKAESLDLDEDDDLSHRPLKISVEDKDSGRLFVERIQNSNLSTIEKNILMLLVQGYNQKEIAQKYKIEYRKVTRITEGLRHTYTKEEFELLIQM